MFFALLKTNRFPLEISNLDVECIPCLLRGSISECSVSGSRPLSASGICPAGGKKMMANVKRAQKPQESSVI